MSSIKLYSYFRSSSAYRVRIALHLKQVPFEIIPVHLLNNGGEQNSTAYQLVNPMGEVPTLVDGDFALAQSMAILSYLDSRFPQPSLFPAEAKLRARVIQFCEGINSGIQPIQNLKVLQELEARFRATQEQKVAWSAHWIKRGFLGLEKILSAHSGNFCFGNELSAADCYLIPQVYNAQRFQVDLKEFPNIQRINEHCLRLPAFQKASPEVQPDAPKA